MTDCMHEWSNQRSRVKREIESKAKEGHEKPMPALLPLRHGKKQTVFHSSEAIGIYSEHFLNF